jgi:hypothetical protein
MRWRRRRTCVASSRTGSEGAAYVGFGRRVSGSSSPPSVPLALGPAAGPRVLVPEDHHKCLCSPLEERLHECGRERPCGYISHTADEPEILGAH